VYRTIETSIWDDERVRQLDDKGKLFFMYLITNRNSHVSGIYHLPDALIRYNLGFSANVLAGLWKTMAQKNLAYRCMSTDVVWVRRMLFYQGKGEKNARAAAKQLETLHNCRLIGKFLEEYAECVPLYKVRHPGKPLQIGYPECDAEAKTETEAEIDQKSPLQIGYPECAVGAGTVTEQEQETGAGAEAVPKAAAREQRGSHRAPADFRPPDSDLQKMTLRFSALDIGFETEKFRDHEFKTPHKDWDATWRTWVRNAEKYRLRDLVDGQNKGDPRGGRNPHSKGPRADPKKLFPEES
jgi:hypothetical protein